MKYGVAPRVACNECIALSWICYTFLNYEIHTWYMSMLSYTGVWYAYEGGRPRSVPESPIDGGGAYLVYLYKYFSFLLCFIRIIF